MQSRTFKVPNCCLSQASTLIGCNFLKNFPYPFIPYLSTALAHLQGGEFSYILSSFVKSLYEGNSFGAERAL